MTAPPRAVRMLSAAGMCRPVVVYSAATEQSRVTDLVEMGRKNLNWNLVCLVSSLKSGCTFHPREINQYVRAVGPGKPKPLHKERIQHTLPDSRYYDLMLLLR